MAAAAKAALEDLLRARRLQADPPPLRGEERLSPLATGVSAVDALLGGGFPRGQVSEIHGPASSGRTGFALAFVGRITRAGALAAWVDPADRLDPASASAAGADLARLLWLRGPSQGGAAAAGARALADASAALAILLDSGLFEAVFFDLAGIPAGEVRRLPGTTWIRLQRGVEATKTALVLLADGHTAQGPGGVSLALSPSGPRWSGEPGPGRLLRGLAAQAVAGRFGVRRAPLELRT
jgi:hypothetical protein